MTSPAVAAPSIDEYLETSVWDGFELEDGIPVEVPMSSESAWVGGEVFGHLRDAARLNDAIVLPQDTPLHIWPDRPRHFRKPDAMYFEPGRLSFPLPTPLDVAPGLVVEVISPNEIGPRIEAKNREYLEGGVKLIWVIYPETQTIYVLRADGSVSYLGPGDALSGEEVVPGFTLPVADIFAPRPGRTP